MSAFTDTTSATEDRSVSPARPHRVLTFTTTFPSAIQPIHGVFVKERVRSVAKLPGCDVRVVSPIPVFPPIRRFKRWYPLSQIAREETVDGLSVTRPRYFLLPKVGKYFHARAMARGARRTMARLAEEFDYDLIDAHFAFPDGVAAARLAERFDKPLVITGRGGDIVVCPKDPVQRKQIEWALKQASRLIAVSQEIADKMADLGATREKITVIPNGVDTNKFQPLPKKDCREALGLPADRPIVLSVGYLLELKGFHLLAEAVHALRRKFDDVLIVIVGGVARWGLDFSAQIEQSIRDNKAEDYVMLAGPRPPQELPKWYSAADVFTLLSSREGCPNAMMEALASGLPCVATPVGGVPQILDDPSLGIVLPERSAAAAGEGLTQALSRTWNRAQIRTHFEQYSWQHTAEKIEHVFNAALRGD